MTAYSPCRSKRKDARHDRTLVLNTTVRIVLLNGVGSAGKGSIAKALQAITTDAFLHVEMDAFLQMLPERCIGHPDGLTFETVENNGKPEVIIKTGPVATRAFRGMRHAIAAMAAQGNNLIVDDVMMSGQMAEYETLLARFELFRVGVLAPLEVLELRERQRGDRMIGLARWQYDRVHSGKKYDLELDTSSATPMECAEMIKLKFQL